jgi:hypothetical protein
MGQSLCKDCEGRFKLPPFVISSSSRHGHIDEDGTSSSCEYDDATSGSLRSHTSNHDSNNGGGNNVDPRRRNNRIKNKKSSVVLHAEFRDRQERGILIAPPLVTEKVMEYTDNVFSGQDMGVEKIHSSSSSSSDAVTSATSSFGDSDYGGIGMGGGGGGGGSDVPHDGNDPDVSLDVDIVEVDDVGKTTSPPESYVKTPEEDAFLDLALSDDDNFVFDGMSDRYRERLKDSMERIVVPRNTLLIRKGDDPDYLYLILEGEVAVYIDPDEYVDDNAVEIGKHAPLDISVPTNVTDDVGYYSRRGGTMTTGNNTPPVAARTTREFKQSYVLQLRRSLFQSNYNGVGQQHHHHHRHEDNGHHRQHRRDDSSIVGQFLSVIRHSIGGHDSNTSNLTGILEDQASRESDEDQLVDNFIPLKELRGLKHERDLGTCDVFGELGEFFYFLLVPA